MAKRIKIYIAGKMSKHSHFDSHNWRDEMLKEVNKATGLTFTSLDPTKATKDYSDLEMVFGSDVYMISEVDVVVVYLSDDISVGGSQEILIAKYFGKPVIGFAPIGGKFNGGTKEVAGLVMKNYKHPFVYSTCDVVCGDMDELSLALQNLDEIKPKTINLIDDAYDKFAKKHNTKKLYEEHLIG